MNLRASIALLALLAAPVVASAHVTRWIATIRSDQSGDTAAMRLRVRDACRLVLQTPSGSEFVCPGRWRCRGTACPTCSAHFVGVGGAEQAVPPFAWTYACFRGSPAQQPDTGTFSLDLAR